MEDFFFTSLSRENLKETIIECFREQISPYVHSLVNERDQTEIITKKEAAKFLKVSEKTIEEWTRNGIIPAHRISRRIRYKKSELEQSLKMINVNSI